MIETITKLFSILLKPVVFVIRYFADRPVVTISVAGAGNSQGNARSPQDLNLTWWTHLILHNDSPNIIRGIKLLSPLPIGWHLKAEIPTRLEPDEKISLPLDINIDKAREGLLQRFGAHAKQEYASLYFPVLLRSVHLEFELKNQRGRTIYQYTTFGEDKRAISISAAKRK